MEHVHRPGMVNVAVSSAEKALYGLLTHQEDEVCLYLAPATNIVLGRSAINPCPRGNQLDI